MPGVTTISPLYGIEGGRITIEGSGFPVDGPVLPDVRVGDVAARVVQATPSRLAVIIPSGLEVGRAEIRISGVVGATAYVDVAAPFATGLHQVDSPVFDRAGWCPGRECADLLNLQFRRRCSVFLTGRISSCPMP